MTRDRGNKSNQNEYEDSLVKGPRAGRESALSNQGMPILAHNRRTSYGSCDDNTREVSAKKQDSRHQPRRHQIGSDVLDFGESALMWLGSLRQRLLKKKPNKISSSLGFSEPFTGREVALTREDNISPPDTANRRFPRIPSIPRHAVDYIETTPLGDDDHQPINKRRTVFSLFDLSASQAEGPDTELEDLTNKSARPRANTVSIPNARTKLLKQATVDKAYDKPRCLSVSKYLEEISKLGANGASESKELSESIEAEPSPAMTSAYRAPSEPLKDTHANNSQQLDRTAFQEVIAATSSTIDNATVTGQSEAYVTSQQRVGKPSNVEAMPTVAASSTFCRQNFNDTAESNGSAVIHPETPSRVKRDTIVTGKPSIGTKSVPAKSKVESPKKPQGSKSASKPKEVKAIEPTSPAKAKTPSRVTPPGFAGMLQAADKGSGHTFGPKQKKEREDVGGGKRPDGAIAMKLEKQKRTV